MDSDKQSLIVSTGLPWNYTIIEINLPLPEISSSTQFVHKITINSNTRQYISKDLATGAFYAISDSSEILYKFDNLEKLLKKQALSSVMLEHPFDGSCFIVHNDFMYSNMDAYNMICLYDAVNGNVLDIANFPDARISLSQDAKTGKVYLLEGYDSEVNITEIINDKTNKLVISNTINIQKNKGNAFAFINNEKFYIGKGIDHDIYLTKYTMSNKVQDVNEFKLLVKAESVYGVNFIPSEGIFIIYMSDPFRIAIYNIV